MKKSVQTYFFRIKLFSATIPWRGGAISFRDCGGVGPELRKLIYGNQEFYELSNVPQPLRPRSMESKRSFRPITGNEEIIMNKPVADPGRMVL